MVFRTRLLLTSLIPSAWVDDQLIAERKAGLAKYLSSLLWSPEYQNAAVFQDFIARKGMNPAPWVTPNSLSTIEWHPDVVSKLKRLIHSAKLSGAGTKIVLSIGMPFIFPG